jgi:hypothetical protein
MKKIGLLQPGRLGDIVICLPIANYFYKKGYKIIWPVFENYINDLVNVVDYVNFIPVSNNIYQCINESKKAFSLYKNIQIYDIAATFPNSTCTEEYVKQGDGFGSVTFDRFKYNVCNVPFEEKWNLSIKRDVQDEEKVYNEMVKTSCYNILGLQHSQGKIDVEYISNYPNILINQKYNFFSWLKVLENAKSIILVDSAMSNLVEQMNLTNKKILITKPKQPQPYFKNNWIIKNI